MSKPKRSDPWYYAEKAGRASGIIQGFMSALKTKGTMRKRYLKIAVEQAEKFFEDYK